MRGRDRPLRGIDVDEPVLDLQSTGDRGIVVRGKDGFPGKRDF